MIEHFYTLISLRKISFLKMKKVREEIARSKENVFRSALFSPKLI